MIFRNRAITVLLLVNCITIAFAMTKIPSTMLADDPLDKLKPFKSVCTCEPVDGVCYEPHPEECDQFIQCNFDKNDPDNTVAVDRRCDFGEYWDRSVDFCLDSTHVECPTEKCDLLPLLSYPVSRVENCGLFWGCNIYGSVGMCCPEGFIYEPYENCVPSDKCKEHCPPMKMQHMGRCHKQPDFEDTKRYWEHVEGLGWKNFECTKGSRYDPIACDCRTIETKECTSTLHLGFNGNFEDYSEYDTRVENHGVKLTPKGFAYFDGNSYIVIPEFSKYNYTSLTIIVRFLALGGKDDKIAIVSNGMTPEGNTTKPSLLMVKSEKNVHFMIETTRDKKSAFHSPIRVENWNEVTFVLDVFGLTVIANELGHAELNYGGMKNSGEALVIGKSEGLKNFVGYIDHIEVFNCRPEYF